MPAKASVPGRVDSTRHSIDPAAQHVAQLISEAIDTNEHVRDQLAAYRQSPSVTDGRRRLVDVALGRLARAHALQTVALHDVERAGGAA